MWLEPQLSVGLGEVFAYGRLKMQCLYMLGPRLSFRLGEVCLLGW